MNPFKRRRTDEPIVKQTSNISSENRTETTERTELVDVDAIKPLIKEKLLTRTLLYKPCAIVMGKTGVGKTTLVNKLCGTVHECGAGSGSITRNLYQNSVSCGENSFSLIDTPGTDSTTETYKHAYLLKQGLTTIPINTIFIVVKYDSRFDKMLEYYYDVEQPVYNYGTKVVVMISYWDLSKEPQKEFTEICHVFEGYCSNIICYSERSAKYEIANLMYSCISNMKQEKLKINDKDFFFNFNVAEIKLRTKKSLDQYRQKAGAISDQFSETVIFVNSATVEEKDEILHMLIVEFKNEMERLLTEFRDKHAAEMNELDYYVFYIKMEKENVQHCDSFVNKVVPLMSYNLFDHGDPRNLIKKCPNLSCGLIWFKTEGCDGVTTCGNNGFSNYFDQRSKPFWKYMLEWVDGKLRWKKNKMDQKQAVKPAEKVGNSNKVGCGQSFTWSQLPKIEDDLILELFKVKTIAEAAKIIRNGSFREVRRNYERSIDSSFHS